MSKEKLHKCEAIILELKSIIDNKELDQALRFQAIFLKKFLNDNVHNRETENIEYGYRPELKNIQDKVNRLVKFMY